MIGGSLTTFDPHLEPPRPIRTIVDNIGIDGIINEYQSFIFRGIWGQISNLIKIIKFFDELMLQEVLVHNGFVYNGFAYNGFFEEFRSLHITDHFCI